MEFENFKLESKGTKKVINFKLFKEDDLEWPVNNHIIKNCHLILPLNGTSKRNNLEQDFNSDSEVVNSAKQKLKRELKQAIEEIEY